MGWRCEFQVQSLETGSDQPVGGCRWGRKPVAKAWGSLKEALRDREAEQSDRRLGVETFLSFSVAPEGGNMLLHKKK